MNDVQKDAFLLNVLDALVEDIRSVEAAYAVTASRQDLRQPIAFYHDAVDALRQTQQGQIQPELQDRLGVEAIQHDVDKLRQRSRQLRHYGGAMLVSLPPELPLQGWWPKLLGRKQQLIMAVEALHIPWQVQQNDLHSFRQGLRLHPLKQLLSQSYAMRKTTGDDGKSRWHPLPAGSFQHSMEQQEEALTASKPPANPLDNVAIRRLWLQSLHPMQCWLAFGGQGTVFQPKTHIPTREWQQRDADAQQLAEAYDRYTVMFAALLADTVEADYQEHMQGLETLMKDCQRLLNWFRYAEEQGQSVDKVRLERWIGEIENEELKKRLRAWLESQKLDTSDGGLKDAVEAVASEAQEQAHHLDKAHVHFVMGQLALFEQHSHLIKEMAGKGLNIAGKYVAAAASMAAGKGKGGGRGA